MFQQVVCAVGGSFKLHSVDGCLWLHFIKTQVPAYQTIYLRIFPFFSNKILARI